MPPDMINVAQGMSADQSTVHNSLGPALAVDGIYYPILANDKCSTTQDGASSAWWSVTFNQPEWVHGIEIINGKYIILYNKKVTFNTILLIDRMKLIIYL